MPPPVDNPLTAADALGTPDTALASAGTNDDAGAAATAGNHGDAASDAAGTDDDAGAAATAGNHGNAASDAAPAGAAPLSNTPEPVPDHAVTTTPAAWAVATTALTTHVGPLEPLPLQLHGEDTNDGAAIS